MTILLQAAALYFLLNALMAICSRLIRALVTIFVFPVRLIRAVNLHRRKCGARELHPAEFFLGPNPRSVTVNDRD